MFCYALFTFLFVSFVEDDVLDIFDSDGDWFLAKIKSDSNGYLGYVPSNYTGPYDSTQNSFEPEDTTTTTTTTINNESEPESQPLNQPQSTSFASAPPPKHPSISNVPSDPPNLSNLQNDHIMTWSVSEISSKKKKKGTLGIGNGAIFFASDSDKTPVQQWSINDLLTYDIEKSKYIYLNMRSSSDRLQFQLSDKKSSEEIGQKLDYSSNLAETNTNKINQSLKDLHVNEDKPRVHFSSNPPSPIEAPAYSSENDDESNEKSNKDVQALAVALYDFEAESDDELTVKEGQKVIVIDRISSLDWWTCKTTSTGMEGVIPASYLQIIEENVKDVPNQSLNENVKKVQVASEIESRVNADEDAKTRVIESERKLKEAATLAANDDISKSTPKRSQSQRKVPSNRPKPNVAKVRVWHDKTGQFKVDAEYLGMNDRKLRLLKMNGVTIEVPREKMSKNDLDFIDALEGSSDNVRKSLESGVKNSVTKSKPVKKSSSAGQFDWFEFFLSSGCGIDECQRYANNFERDKMDEGILFDIDSSTLRTLGLKEGDIIRVNKAILSRKMASGTDDPERKEQIKRDEEYARQLEQQEQAPPPNIFTSGPGGALKNTRRGRPQVKSPVSAVDDETLASAKDSLTRNNTGYSNNNVNNLNNEVNLLDTHADDNSNLISPSAVPVDQIPSKRSSSTTPLASGFDDDAWTVKDNPTTTTTLNPSPTTTTQTQTQASLTPPIQLTQSPPAQQSASNTPTVQPSPQPIQPTPSPQPPANPNSMDGIMAKIQANKEAQTEAQSQSQLQQQQQQQQQLQQQLQMQQQQLAQQQQQLQQLTSPKGPLAPVPQNQGLLQPLIPTNTGLNTFVPTGGSNLIPQQTGFNQMQPPPMQNPPISMASPLQPQHTSITGFQQQMQPKGSCKLLLLLLLFKFLNNNNYSCTS